MPSLSLRHLLLIALAACAIGAVVGLAKPAPAHAACTPFVATLKYTGNWVQGDISGCAAPEQVCLRNNDGHGWSQPFNCHTGGPGDVVTLLYQMTCGWAIYYQAMGRYNWGPWVYGINSVTC